MKRSSLAVVLTALYLLVLRILVFSFGSAGLGQGDLWSRVVETPVVAVGLLAWLASSLCFELVFLFALVALSRARPTRWLARVLLLAMLWLNLAATQVFIALRTYAKGFQLLGLNASEAVAMVVGALTPITVAGLLAAVVLAWVWGHPDSLERAPVTRRTGVLLGLLVLTAGGVVTRQLLAPAQTVAFAHSPLTLLFVRYLPLNLSSLPVGPAAVDDWAPSTTLAPKWAGLEKEKRDFNVVLVGLESVRFDSFWPSANAPPMPRLAALAPRSAVFSRAYAHVPFTTKAIESLVFGIYPAPVWETVGDASRKSIALETTGGRLRALGMRTAFISTVPIFDDDQRFFSAHGFDEVLGPEALKAIDSELDDRALVPALEGFLDRGGGQRRFAAMLWTRHTHVPYVLPKGKGTKAASSKAAYLEAIASEDEVIGDLVAMLERKGHGEDTVVVLLGDHGQSFNEHPESGTQHGNWLFETNTHVPLVLLNPRLFHGEVDDRLVQQKDVAASLPWLAGDERPQLNHGTALFFQRKDASAYVMAHMDVSRLRGAVIHGPWKFHFQEASEGVREENRLYDVLRDPEENVNLWDAHRAEGEALKGRYFGWLRHFTERWMALDQSGKLEDPKAVRRLLLDEGTP